MEQLPPIAKALEVMQRTFAAVTKEFRPGISERALALWLRCFFRTHGYPHVSFDPIVAFGPSAAEPHHQPGNRLLKRNQMIKIDCGVRVAGTATDMTRTFFYGRAGTLFRKRYHAVLEAQRRAIAAIRPGVTASDVDTAARSYLEQHRLGAYFIHGTGHGIGYRIHQQPYLRAGNEVRLQSGKIVTVEPGVYVSDWGGIRIEDMVLITEQGHRVLSGAIPKTINSALILA